MENEELMRIVRGKECAANAQNLTLSNGKTYFLDAIRKGLRNVDDPLDSIDIEQLVGIKELPVLMECKCGKWLFVNPEWKNAYRPNYPSRRP